MPVYVSLLTGIPSLLSAAGSGSGEEQAEPAAYDVFLSISGCDRRLARRLARKIRNLGLRVFLDEDEILRFRRLTPQIKDAIAGSTVFVILYSQTYPERPSCQLELIAAFLAGQETGDPTERILVINLEDDSRHIVPVELADARYLPTAAMGDWKIVFSIRERVLELGGRIGTAAGGEGSPVHYGRAPGIDGFVGRHRELWRLHSVLHAPEHPYSQERTHGPIARVVGMPGIGKSSLVAAYAYQFGAAFPGGVFWTALGHQAPRSAASYRAELARLADLTGVEVAEHHSYERVRGALGSHLGQRREPVLWIVDEVPGAMSDSVIHDLVLPAGPHLRTVVISDQDSAAVAPSVRLDGLTGLDGGRLLDAHRPARDPADEWARDRIVELLGGHPTALTEVGLRLRELDGERPYEIMCHHLGVTADPPAREIGREVLAALTPKQRFVLSLAGAYRERPVRTERLAKIFDHLGLGEGGEPGTAFWATLGTLRQRFLISGRDPDVLVNPALPYRTERRPREAPMYHHVQILRQRASVPDVVLDLDEDALEATVLAPYRAGADLLLDGQIVRVGEVGRVRITRTDEALGGFMEEPHHHSTAAERAVRAGQIADTGIDVTTRFLDRAPGVDGAVVSVPDRRRVFLVVGRWRAAREAMETFLRSLDLDVVLWEDAVAAGGEASRYPAEILDTGFGMCHAVVVFMTPDDLSALHPALRLSPTEDVTPHGQPRPNVIFEAGMAWQRSRRRTLIVTYGDLDTFSDLKGVDRVRFDGSAKSRYEVVDRLKAMGVPASERGGGWLSAGQFPPALPSPSAVEPGLG
jgi:predicted nucleotide-binding protein